MRVKKKEIVNEFITKKAEEKGFLFSWDGTKFWDKQYLASFSREGYGQNIPVLPWKNYYAEE